MSCSARSSAQIGDGVVAGVMDDRATIARPHRSRLRDQYVCGPNGKFAYRERGVDASGAMPQASAASASSKGRPHRRKASVAAPSRFRTWAPSIHASSQGAVSGAFEVNDVLAHGTASLRPATWREPVTESHQAFAVEIRAQAIRPSTIRAAGKRTTWSDRARASFGQSTRAGHEPLTEGLLLSSAESGDHLALDSGYDPPRLADDAPSFLSRVDFEDPAIAGTGLSRYPAPALEREHRNNTRGKAARRAPPGAPGRPLCEI